MSNPEPNATRDWQVRAVACKTCTNNRAWAVYWTADPKYPGTRQHMGTFAFHADAVRYAHEMAEAATHGDPARIVPFALAGMR